MLEAGQPEGQAAADHRRRRRGRGAGGAGRQQAPRRAQRLRGEGPRLRRSPQGDAGRHRRAHRRHGHQRRPGHQARERRRSSSSAGPRRSRVDQGQHDDRRGRRQEGRHPEADRADSQGRSRAPTSDYDREKLQERLAKLTGGVAIISRRRRQRSRHEAEEGPRRRRAARHARGRRRRHPARRRRGPAALQAKPSRRLAPRPRATRRSASTSSPACSTRRCKQIADNGGVDGSVVADEVSQKPAQHRLRRQQPASTSTCSRPASSTRRRS